MPSNYLYWLITLAVGIGIAIISFFLKRTMKTQDDHELQLKNTPSRAELSAVSAKAVADVQVVGETVDGLAEKVHQVELRYATKEELRNSKQEVNDAVCKIAADVATIKDDYLTKEDFYRSQTETNKKLDTLTDYVLQLLKGKGGPSAL